MGDIFKNSFKAAMILFVVGTLLALAVPPVAVALGFAADTAAAAGLVGAPGWLGVYFGVFGAINGFISTAAEKAFGAKPAPKEESICSKQDIAKAPVELEISGHTAHAQEPPSRAFTEKLEIKRAEPMVASGIAS